MIPFLPHSSGLELSQLIVAAAGLGLSIWAMLDALRTRQRIGDLSPDDARFYVVQGVTRGALARLVLQVVLVLTGVACVVLPPPPYPVGVDPRQAHLIQLGLMLATAILTIDSLGERQNRLHALAQLERKRLADIKARIRSAAALLKNKVSADPTP
jgi:hypothetical protein